MEYMPHAAFDKAIARLARQTLSSFGSDVRRLREDAGVTRAMLARAAGVDASYIVEIEMGEARPSLETCLRLTAALGCDLPLRAFPTTGPSIRDRHQAAITEAILSELDGRWTRFLEIAVRRPSRGWIDLGLHDPAAGVLLATEIQSELRRLEQLLRWSALKAEALPSWEGWPRLEPTPSISRLLVVRDTRATRAVATDFRRMLRDAFPADPVDGLAALTGSRAWPGPVLLWATRKREGVGYRLVAR